MPNRSRLGDLREEFENLRAAAKKSSGERKVKEVLSFKDFTVQHIAPLTSGFEDDEGNIIKRLDYKHLDLLYEIAPVANKFLELDHRGSLKSTILSFAYPIWRLYYNPDCRFILSSSTRKLAQANLYAVAKALLEFGVKPYNPDRWTQDSIILARSYIGKDPSAAAVSAEGGATGFHGDHFVGDDLHDEKNSVTADRRAHVRRFLHDMRNIIDPSGQWIVVGTRWHFDDVYSDLIARGKPYVAGMDLKKERGWVYNIRGVWENEENRIPLFREKFPPEYIDELRKDLPADEFALQYLNNPMQRADKPFKKEWLVNYNPSLVPWSQPDMGWVTMQAVDLIRSEKERRDWFVSLILSRNRDGLYYLRKITRRQCLIPEQLDLIKTDYEQFHPYKLVVDSTIFQIMIVNFLQAATNWPVFGIDQRINKEVRIRSLSPFFEKKRILVDMNATVAPNDWYPEFEREYLEYPDSKWDDQLDALAMAFQGFGPTQSPAGLWPQLGFRRRLRRL
jgi:predicted phage terminase large subunit-like protein